MVKWGGGLFGLHRKYCSTSLRRHIGQLRNDCFDVPEPVWELYWSRILMLRVECCVSMAVGVKGFRVIWGLG